MKNFLLIICLLFSGMQMLNAQAEAGKVLIGTSTNLTGSSFDQLVSAHTPIPSGSGLSIISRRYISNTSNFDLGKLTKLNLSPRIGFFAANNLLVGLEAIFLYISSEGISATTIAGGPFARYYFSSGNFKPFVQLDVSKGQIKFSDIIFRDINVSSYGAGVGGAFFLNDKVAVDLLVNYSHAVEDRKGNDAVGSAGYIMSSFGIDFGFSIFL